MKGQSLHESNIVFFEDVKERRANGQFTAKEKGSIISMAQLDAYDSAAWSALLVY